MNIMRCFCCNDVFKNHTCYCSTEIQVVDLKLDWQSNEHVLTGRILTIRSRNFANKIAGSRSSAAIKGYLESISGVLFNYRRRVSSMPHGKLSTLLKVCCEKLTLRDIDIPSHLNDQKAAR